MYWKVNDSSNNHFLLFSRNDINTGKDVIDGSGDEVSSDDQIDLEDHTETHSIRVPLVHRPETSFSSSNESLASTNASTPTILSPDFSPWLYRPTPLPGYLPLQTGFITSRFAGMVNSSSLHSKCILP